MKLLHRPDSLKGLNIQSLRSAGFDTIQYGFTTDDARNIDALCSRIENALSPFTDGNQIDVYLALLLEGDDRVFPDSPYSPNAVQLETYQRVTSAGYYDDIEAVVRGIAHRTRAGARLKGVRWNHEYSPVCWKLDSAWTRYARAHASPENYVVENFRSDEWHRFRQAVAPKSRSSTLPKIKARDAYRGPTTSPWNSRDYAEVRTLYRHLVDFQALEQAKAIGKVSEILTDVDDDLKLIIYPPAQSPTVYARLEYSLDMSLNDLDEKNNIVWEFGDWDFHSKSSIPISLKKWAAQADKAGAPYFFTLQAGSSQQGHETRVANLNTLVAARYLKDEDGSALSGTSSIDRPWLGSFGYWSAWTSAAADAELELSDFPRRTGESEEAHRERYEEARKVRDKSVAQQTDYVQKLKTALQTYG